MVCQGHDAAMAVITAVDWSCKMPYKTIFSVQQTIG